MDIDKVAGIGFENAKHLPGSTFVDSSTVIVIPTRGIQQVIDNREVTIPAIHQKVIAAWQCMVPLPNQKRQIIYTTGDEVGIAYNKLIQNILDTPNICNFKYVLTLEDDNLPPSDAHIRLAEVLYTHPEYDAISGLYFSKNQGYSIPIAYGDPLIEDSFLPRDILEASKINPLVEVNGMGMGCCLWRMDLFKTIPAPWFVTICEAAPEKVASVWSQDLSFCRKARKAGKRFAIDTRVKVGHLDITTGLVY